MTVNSEKNSLILADIVAKCWNDSAYKENLIKSPETALIEAGIKGISHEVSIKILENSDSIKYVILPSKDKVAELGGQVRDFLSKLLPFAPGLKLAFVQNSSNLVHILIPAKPSGFTGKLDSSHAQVLTATSYESVNIDLTLVACAVIDCNTSVNQVATVVVGINAVAASTVVNTVSAVI